MIPKSLKSITQLVAYFFDEQFAVHLQNMALLQIAFWNQLAPYVLPQGKGDILVDEMQGKVFLVHFCEFY